MASNDWYFEKENKNSKIWWLQTPGKYGTFAISFDKKKIYHLFRDYPYELTSEEKAIFDKEYPDYVNYFFKSRNAEYEAMQKKKSKK